MLPITTIQDYKGFTLIPTNRHTELGNLITYFEPLIIKEVLNDYCYKQISTQNPLQSKYTDLIAGGYYTNSDDEEVHFRGLKEALLNRIYYDFNRQNFTPTQSGAVKNAYENSTPLTTSQLSGVVFERYNNFVDIYRHDLVPFLATFEASKTTSTASVANIGTYTLSVPNTKYLYANDTVTIDEVEYVVFAVVDNTSIEIVEATMGLDFTGKVVEWTPFGELEMQQYGKLWLF
jgi:hypothetical protein